MERNVSILIHLFITFFTAQLVAEPVCKSRCGSLEVKYPFGTGLGCGSPRFSPYVSCAPGAEQLLLTTHTGSYPITSISYPAGTFIVTPPLMSTCSAMHRSPNLGLDWASPFQLGPSTFILLSCTPPTSSLTKTGSPLCDAASVHLCASIYTCPSVESLGLPLFAATNTCCVYSPANLNSKGELDLLSLKCLAYASVVSLGDDPTDPSRWEYGVALKYNAQVGFDNYNIASRCVGCESSGGVCGYAPPGNSFACVCGKGFNSSSDCNSYSQEIFWSSDSQKTRNIWLGILAGIIFCIATWEIDPYRLDFMFG